MMQKSPSPSTIKQIATCAVLVLLGIAVTILVQSRPLFHEWRVGVGLWAQILLAAGFGAMAAAGMEIAFRLPLLHNAMKLPTSLQAINLAGYRPLAIAAAAGLGEEILFRAALQPLIGLWLASTVFAVAHFRTASLVNSTGKQLLYLVNVFVVGVALGMVFRYLGLVIVILVHSIVDFVALLSLRRLQAENRVAT